MVSERKGWGEKVRTVVQEQHDGGEFVRDAALSKRVVAKVADVFYLRVLHYEFVHGEGGDVEEDTGDKHGDDAGDPT
jgi:hypothetical protein